MPDDETAGDIQRRIGILRSYAQAIPVAPEVLDLDLVMRYFEGALNALEAVLKLAPQWEAIGNRRGSAMEAGRAQTGQTCAAELREAITRALTGEAGNEPSH